MQSVIFYGHENALTILPVKATYGFKKDYVAMTKPGFILMDIIPIEKNTIGEAKEVRHSHNHRVHCHGKERSRSHSTTQKQAVFWDYLESSTLRSTWSYRA